MFDFRSLFTRKASQSAAFPVDPTIQIGSPYGVARQDFRAQDAYREARSWAMIAATRNSVALASARLRLFAKQDAAELDEPKNFPFRVHRKAIQPGDPTVIEIMEHPFLDLMDTVSRSRDQFDFMQETSLYLDLTGDAYWWIRPGPLGVPAELWSLRSDRVTIIPDTQGGVKEYRYGLGANTISIAPDRIVHFRAPSIREYYYGMGKIEVAYRAVCTDREREQYELQLFHNRGISEMTISPKGTTILTDPQARELEVAFANKMRDGRPKVLKGDIQVDKISFSPREMLALESRRWNVREILNAFGQSEALYSETAIRANVEAAIYSWGKFEIDPALTRIAQKINAQVLPMYDDRLYCAFDTQAMRDKEFDLRQEQADISGHVRTVNEIRLSRQLAPFDDPRADDPFYVGTPAVLSQPGDEDEDLEAEPGKMDGGAVHRTLKGIPISAEYP